MSLTHLLSIFKRFSSTQYWERRYATGGDSGRGSEGVLAEFKADFLNTFVAEKRVSSVIEFGCGDGRQLSLSNYPKYVGIDVSQTAIEKCRTDFREDGSKRFYNLTDHDGEKADLAISVDVIFHLVEDHVFREYMNRLFNAAERFVIIYSSNFDAPPLKRQAPHVRHRHFTDYVDANIENWSLLTRTENPLRPDDSGRPGSFSDFFVFTRRSKEAF